MFFIVATHYMRLFDHQVQRETHYMRLYKYNNHYRKRNRIGFALLLDYNLKITHFLYYPVHPNSQKLL
jgi:hypothetical protein